MLQYKCPKCEGLLVSRLQYDSMGNGVLVHRCTECGYIGNYTTSNNITDKIIYNSTTNIRGNNNE